MPIRDFCFAKRSAIWYLQNEKYLPPGAIIAKNMAEDPRKEPQYRERALRYLLEILQTQD